MVENRCGKCFNNITDERFDACVGCWEEGNIEYGTASAEPDEWLYAVCDDVAVCNHTSVEGIAHNYALCE